MVEHTCTDVCNELTTFDIVYVSNLIAVMFKIVGTDRIYMIEPLNEYDMV